MLICSKGTCILLHTMIIPFSGYWLIYWLVVYLDESWIISLTSPGSCIVPIASLMNKPSASKASEITNVALLCLWKVWTYTVSLATVLCGLSIPELSKGTNSVSATMIISWFWMPPPWWLLKWIYLLYIKESKLKLFHCSKKDQMRQLQSYMGPGAKKHTY